MLQLVLFCQISYLPKDTWLKNHGFPDCGTNKYGISIIGEQFDSNLLWILIIFFKIMAFLVMHAFYIHTCCLSVSDFCFVKDDGVFSNYYKKKLFIIIIFLIRTLYFESHCYNWVDFSKIPFYLCLFLLHMWCFKLILLFMSIIQTLKMSY